MINNWIKSLDAYFSKLTSLPTIIVMLLILGLVILLITVVVIIISLRQGAKKKAIAKNIAKDPNEEAAPPSGKGLPSLGVPVNEFLIKKGYLQVSDLEKSFLKALEFLKSTLNVANYKYKLPWFLLIGAEESGKTSLMEGSNLNLPVGAPSFDGKKAQCRWWFLNRGVVLDISGRFLVNARGTGSNENGWRSLLIALSRYRAARPINGIMLTISAEELYGKYRLSLEEINERANFISHKLQAAQSSLGLKVPVYLIITKTDVIPGFQSLCAEIPHSNRQNIFGWSSPYSPANAYSSKWVDEAFSKIDENLNDVRMEILASNRPSETRDGVFVFPVEFKTIKERLNLYINNIFKNDTYQETPLLRGIYLVGDSGIDQFNKLDFDTIADNVDAPQSKETRDLLAPDRRKIFFIDDLISEKIFYEAGVCKPLSGRILSINRGINIAKVGTACFAAISSVGLYNAYENFSEQRTYMMPVLKKMNTLLHEMQKIQINEPNQSTVVFETYAREFIDVMNRMQNASFFSVFVPPSWFSPLRRDMNETLKISYQQIIIKSIYTTLLIKARHLLNLRPTVENRSESLSHLLKPLAGKEWALVRNYVFDLSKLENMIQKYNNLRTTSDAKDLDDLVDFTFNARLPQQFVDHYTSIRELTENIPFPAIDLAPFQNMARETLGIIYQNYLNSLFNVEDRLSLPGRISEFLKGLANTKAKRAPEIKAFRQFSIDLATGKHHLGEPGKTWMDQEYFNPGKEFNEVFDLLDANERLFGKKVSQFLIDQTAIGFENLKNQLKTFNLTLVGFKSDLPVSPIKKERAEQKFSQGIIELAEALEALFNEPYMAEAQAVRFNYQVPPGKMLKWDANMIDMAYEMAKSFDDFLAKHVDCFPKLLQENLRIMARESLQSNVVALVSRAQNFVSVPTTMVDRLQSEEILSAMIGDVRNVGPKFLKLLELMNQGTVGFSFTELRGLLGNSYFWLLSEVEKQLNTTMPFAVKDPKFTWWDGHTNAAYNGFSVRDQTDLQNYVAVQREQVKRLISYAEPIVVFLSSQVMIDAPGDKNILNKWRRMAEQFRAAETRQAGSTYAQLEDFVIKTMNTYTSDNVTKLIPICEVKQPSGDYFQEVMRVLKKGLLGRAEVLKRQVGVKNYEVLAEIFNTKLRGRFPFVPESQAGNEADANPDDIFEFFKKYDDFGGSPEKILDQIYQLGAPAQSAVAFLQNMKEVKAILEPYLNNVTSTVTFDMKTDFKVFRDQSTGINNLTELYVKVGGTSVVNTDKNNTTRWTYGSPVELGFRFASGRDPKPVADAANPNYRVQDSTASYFFSSGWSLLKAIRVLNAKNLTGTGSKYVLGFNIPTSGSNVKCYNSVTLTTPPASAKDVGREIKLPEFPIDAPNLGSEVKKYVDQAALAEGTIESTPYKPKAVDQATSPQIPDVGMSDLTPAAGAAPTVAGTAATTGSTASAASGTAMPTVTPAATVMPTATGTTPTASTSAGTTPATGTTATAVTPAAGTPVAAADPKKPEGILGGLTDKVKSEDGKSIFGGLFG